MNPVMEGWQAFSVCWMLWPRWTAFDWKATLSPKNLDVAEWPRFSQMPLLREANWVKCCFAWEMHLLLLFPSLLVQQGKSHLTDVVGLIRRSVKCAESCARIKSNCCESQSIRNLTCLDRKQKMSAKTEVFFSYPKTWPLHLWRPHRNYVQH